MSQEIIKRFKEGDRVRQTGPGGSWVGTVVEVSEKIGRSTCGLCSGAPDVVEGCRHDAFIQTYIMEADAGSGYDVDYYVDGVKHTKQVQHAYVHDYELTLEPAAA